MGRSRERARQTLERALKVGDKSTAFQYANKCLDVTTDLAYELILTLRSEGIDYLVAPYEADAQMAYLNKMGLVDAIITEDSDLILFGCQKVTKTGRVKSGRIGTGKIGARRIGARRIGAGRISIGGIKAWQSISHAWLDLVQDDPRWVCR